MKKRIYNIVLAIFTVLLLSVVTGCRPFAAAEAHTKTDGGAGESDVTSLKADGDWRMSFSCEQGTVTFTHTSGGLMVQGPYAINGPVKATSDTTAEFSGTLVDGMKILSKVGCTIYCDFSDKTCRITW
ncbi:MAG: hypothetical protein K6A43_07585 [Treponema sp.]|nr:hypothetical protein [Treponema sp.]